MAGPNPTLAAGTASTGFHWPGPPYAAYRDEDATDKHLDCEVEGVNGVARNCRFTSIDLAAQMVYLEAPLVKKTMRVSFAQCRRVTLKQRLRPHNSASSTNGAIADLLNYHPTMSYTMRMLDDSVQSGQTVGHVETDWGLFLFPPMDDSGAVQRVFMPRSAYTRIQFGAPIGQVLVEQHAVRKSQIEAVAKEQTHLRSRKLGDYLVSHQVVAAEELVTALEQQSRMPLVRTGEALVALDLITESQLSEALQKQKQERDMALGELLVQSGVVTRQDLQIALARKMGYPVVDVANFPLEESALRKVPFALAKRLNFLPLLLREGTLVIAIEDPSQYKPIEEIEFSVQAKVVPALGDPVKIKEPLIGAYKKLDRPGEGVSGILMNDGVNLIEFNAAEVDKLVGTLEVQHLNLAKEDGAERAIEQSDNSLVKLINTIVIDAYNKGVSDIHIETYPGERKMRVRFRKDGVMSPYLELPSSYRSAVIGRIKIMSDLDISERRMPQDGKIDFSKFSSQHKIELRVATIPTIGGLEDIVLRILDTAKPMRMEKLGMSKGNAKRLRDAVSRPYGMVLCVGPTGSGKTTTLHALLGYLNTPERKIWTAEDPVEITQPDMRQVQMNPKIGWTFDKALRTFLRADPDVIMVGEIRDRETAQMAIEASLTGHLVLSTLHTNSAPETVIRLLDMGMDPFNFGDSLLAVLAQRLIRRLCQHCKQSKPMAPEELTEMLDDYLHVFPADLRPNRKTLQHEWEQHFGHEGVLSHSHAPGCAHCEGTGMKGRVGVHELMVNTPELRHLIQTGARPEQLQHEAMAHGHLRTLRQDGIEKVLSGLVSLHEVRANCN